MLSRYHVGSTHIYNPWIADYGFNQFVDTRAKFSADGGTAYVVTAIAAGGLTTDRCFLYAISTGGSNPPPPLPPSQYFAHRHNYSFPRVNGTELLPLTEL